MAKKSVVASFVEAKDGKRTKAPKSLTPKVKASGDKARAGKYAKEGPY
jgi:hypothetical protein